MATQAISVDKSQKPPKTRFDRRKFLVYLKGYWTLYLMMVAPIVFFLVFRYTPMIHILRAFQKNDIIHSVWDVPWAKNNGMEWFIKAFKNKDFLYALRNTIMLNLLDLVVGFPAPIILALLLNELTFKKFKRVTQTIAYMPHFLSWIIISGIALQLFAPASGMVNIFLGQFGVGPIHFLDRPTNWVVTYILLGVWHGVGWNTIIYLAALTSINPELYEAASVDGASRLKKMWHITLPGLKPTIVVLLIMNLGRILGSEFDRPYALSNNYVTEVANVISVFVYQSGIKGMQFSLTTAVGLFQSVICVIFLLAANALAEKLGERGIW